MRRTRAQYHYAIKRSKSQNEQIKKFKVMHALFSIKDNGQIADIFAKQYKELFNSNPSNPEDLGAMSLY